MGSAGRSDWEAGPTQVLVVGAGPAGLVAGVVLARYGVDVVVVDGRGERSTLSRALVISTRNMELLRSWGLEDQVRAGAADVEPRAWVTHTLTSGAGAEIPLGYPTATEAARVSPTRPAWAPQDHLEPLLLDLLRSSPHVTVQFGLELVSLHQSEHGVSTVLRSRESGTVRHLDATYVVGADGAHSTVRTQLGIGMEGPDDLAEFHRVEFRAPLIDLVGEHRYGLYVITHPDAGGVLALRGRGDGWGLSREWRPGQRRLADYGPDQIVALIRTAAGTDRLPIELERTSSFSFAAQIADRYQYGRCFLVGDAAHRMTPRGGTGMNTAIQDANDLAWKLGWVLRGWAKPELLDTYEADRRPVGRHNVRRSSEPDGGKRDAVDALPWDLNGRLAHHWVHRGDRTVSTLDILDEGLTLLTGPQHSGWADAADRLGIRAPVSIRPLDAAGATALGLGAAGAILVRPDAIPVAQWSGPTAPIHTGGLPLL